ncbi:MAG: hypothetical protein RIC55_28220, partial [Pirellulaceae bacterium]
MRYIVPAGTELLTALDARRRQWKAYMTRRSLVFPEYRLKDADEFTFVYRGRLLRVARSATQERPDFGIVVYSLILAIVREPPVLCDLVVPLDEHAECQFTRPANPHKTLLDIGSGDVVIHQGRPETV